MGTVVSSREKNNVKMSNEDDQEIIFMLSLLLQDAEISVTPIYLSKTINNSLQVLLTRIQTAIRRNEIIARVSPFISNSAHMGSHVIGAISGVFNNITSNRNEKGLILPLSRDSSEQYTFETVNLLGPILSFPIFNRQAGQRKDRRQDNILFCQDKDFPIIQIDTKPTTNSPTATTTTYYFVNRLPVSDYSVCHLMGVTIPNTDSITE